MKNMADDPFVAEQQGYWRERIRERFSDVAVCEHHNYLALQSYVLDVPERFFHEPTRDVVFRELCRLRRDEPRTLVRILCDFAGDLDTAYRALHELNQLDVHEGSLPTDYLETAAWFDAHINPAWLKLTEAVYSRLILPLSAWLRIRRNAGLDGFDTYQRVEELRKAGYVDIVRPYSNVIRNAIAHGSVQYGDLDITYVDRKEQRLFSYYEAASLFDNMLDVANGIALACHMFMLVESDFLTENGVRLPQSLAISELKFQLDSWGWAVRWCIETGTVHGSKQLTIYTEDSVLRPMKFFFYAIRTAILAEQLIPGFDRYFIHAKSKYSMLSFAGFNGEALKSIREKSPKSLLDYGTAIDKDRVSFAPRFRLPRFVFFLANLVALAKSHLKVRRWRSVAAITPLRIHIRESRIHRNGLHAIVHASVVVTCGSAECLESLVRTRRRAITRTAIKHARKHAESRGLVRSLRVGFAHISVFTRDYRVRRLRNSGLMPDLLCTIQLIKLRRIRIVDIIGGIPEQAGKVRLVWNSNSPKAPKSGKLG